MKREGGLWATAAVLGVVATVGISSPQPKLSPAPGISKSTEASSANLLAMQSIDKGPCADFEKRLQSFLLVEENEVVAPASCYPAVKQPAPSQKLLIRATQLRFIIATLPDPLHTHFPLSFDRSAEAIQQAAQDDHYIYDSSRLPWETEETSYGRLKDQDESEKRTEQNEDQPGLLLFRRSVIGKEPNDLPFENGLVVLIVGEEPTGGIHRQQFENAVQWIQALQPSDTGELRSPLQILGPSFSGSIPSLVELLRNTPGIDSELNAPLRIFSGSVTSNVLVNWLHTMATDYLSSLHVQFRSFSHSGDVNIDRYCSYLYAAGSDLARLAIVSEDETAFGGEYGKGDTGTSPCAPEDPHKPGPVHLYYPRDISALRAAYQSQSIFSRATAQANGDSLHRTLQDDLADPKRKDHDTIRTYSDNQNSLSQEAELQQLVSLMRAHKTQYILLRSSNPLDQLFLSQFFRMTYPEGRIVLAGADLLLRRETGASGLNGVMTLSTYPLLPWEQDWTKTPAPGKFHSHRAFTNDGVEGTYFAARFLLWAQASAAMTSEHARDATAAADGAASADAGFIPSNCIPDFNLTDYALPFWMKSQTPGCRHPPTWLSVLGNGGFWPVAVLDTPVDLKHPLYPAPDPLPARLWHSVTSIFTSIAFLFGWHHDRQAAGPMPQAWLPMPLSMRLLMLAGAYWAAFHLLCCCRASITAKPAHRAHFVRPNSNSPHPLTECDDDALRHQQNSHRALVLLGSILVALLPITLAWGYGEMWEGGEPLPDPWRYRTFLPLIWLTAAGAVAGNAWIEDHLFWRPDVQESVVPPAPVRRSLLWFTGISLLLYWCLDFFLDFALNDSNRIPTYWRAINLTTGVSPLVPLVALIAGFYGWFWFSLQGLALVGEDRPQLPPAESLRISRPEQETSSEGSLDDVLRILSREGAARDIERLSSPFASEVWLAVGICFIVIFLMALLVFGYPPIRNLGSNDYSVVFGFWLVLCISMLLANAWQLSRVWLTLRHLLQFLDKLPLRRTFAAFQGFSWGSVWKMGGSVFDMRYMLVFRQMESLSHLRRSLLRWEEKRQPEVAQKPICKLAHIVLPSACGWIELIDETSQERAKFAQWYARCWNVAKNRRVLGLCSLQRSLAETAAVMITQLLIPTWRGESRSLLLTPSDSGKPSDSKDKPDPNAASVSGLPRHIRNAEELVCLVYMAFIQNVLGRMRSLVMGIICMFIAIAAAIASYPFDPRPLLSAIVVTLFVILGVTIIAVYSQMHRDTTLSNLTATTPGELGGDFWLKLIGFGVGPVLGLIASVFPEFTDFLFSWVQPGLGSVK